MIIPTVIPEEPIYLLFEVPINLNREGIEDVIGFFNDQNNAPLVEKIQHVIKNLMKTNRKLFIH